jgi:hypothetical protein
MCRYPRDAKRRHMNDVKIMTVLSLRGIPARCSSPRSAIALSRSESPCRWGARPTASRQWKASSRHLAQKKSPAQQ